MKNAELRAMALSGLEEKLLASKNDLARLKSMRAGGTKSEKPSDIRTTRRMIARVLTLLNEKKTRGEVSQAQIQAAESAAIAKVAGPAKAVPKTSPKTAIASKKKKGAQ